MKTQLKKLFNSSELDDPSVKSSAKLPSAKDEIAPLVVHNPLYTIRSCTPDVKYKTICDNTQSYNPTYQTEFFHGNLPSDVHMKAFAHESLGRAIVVSEITATVSGRLWMVCYMDALSEKERSEVIYLRSANTFKVGTDGNYKSPYKITISVQICSSVLYIEVDAIEYDITLLLSKEFTKKANMTINFEDDSVKIFVEKLVALVTTAGNYAVPLSRNMKILSDIIARSFPITLNIQSIDPIDNSKLVSVIQSKFSLFSPCTLLNFIKSAYGQDNTCLFKEMLKVTNGCEFCKKLLF